MAKDTSPPLPNKRNDWADRANAYIKNRDTPAMKRDLDMEYGGRGKWREHSDGRGLVSATRGDKKRGGKKARKVGSGRS